MPIRERNRKIGHVCWELGEARVGLFDQLQIAASQRQSVQGRTALVMAAIKSVIIAR